MEPTVQEQIDAHRKANAARRSRAFVDCPDKVLGMAVCPLTLRTWTRLHAVESRFVTGETPMEGDVRNYLWFHSRLWQPVKWYTVPTFAKWLALLPFNAVLHWQKDAYYYGAVVAMAATDIRGIIDETFADAAREGRKDGLPPQGCLEAQLIHLFAKAYGWTPAYTRRKPLAQLIQLSRQFSRDSEDETEKAIKVAHLRRRNAELQREREAKKLMAELQPKTETT